MTETVSKLAYLLGVPEVIMKTQYGVECIRELEQVEDAANIRAYCRARQVVLFHFTNGKKIFSLPDSLRTYCHPGMFERLQEEYQHQFDGWEFVNSMTDYIMDLLPQVLEDLRVPYPNAISELIFQWPKQNKVSLTNLSIQYHNKKMFSYPHDCFIPKPSTFKKSLPYLLTADKSLYNAPPIKLRISAQAANAASLISSFQMPPAPPEWDMPHVVYVNELSILDNLSAGNGLQISYIDFDNMPAYIIAQVCKRAAETKKVKIFFDDRARGEIDIFRTFPDVSLHYVERLKAEKSLVDSQIVVEAMQDCYMERPAQAVLYSSDSDFFALAPALSRQGVNLSVVGLEGNISTAYVKRLGEFGMCYVLSEQAAAPTLDRELIREVLGQLLVRRPLSEINVDELASAVLESFVEQKYQALLQKGVEAEVSRLLAQTQLAVHNGGLSVRFPEADLALGCV